MAYFDLSKESYPDEYVFESGDFEEVEPEEFEGNGRWSIHYSQILKYKDGTFWRANWSRGATEYQDDGVEDLRLIQVEPYEVTVTKYKAV
jgi:hypothetical protein